MAEPLGAGFAVVWILLIRPCPRSAAVVEAVVAQWLGFDTPPPCQRVKVREFLQLLFEIESQTGRLPTLCQVLPGIQPHTKLSLLPLQQPVSVRSGHARVLGFLPPIFLVY